VSPTSRLAATFATCRSEQRAALIGYMPAGYPDLAGSIDVCRAMVESGCDIVEVGVAYSDPVMDGPTIQTAADQALRGGIRVKDVFSVIEAISEAGARAVVMSYWNPVLKYGVDRFARDLAGAGGAGMITPNLIPEEADDWFAASAAHDLDRIFLVAPSSTEERLDKTLRASSGFVYASSTMGVTGARDAVSAMAPALCRRIREHSDIPIGVGLGVRSGGQAAEIAAYADGVIVGSAIVSAVPDGLTAVRSVTSELAHGVRSAAVVS